MVREWLKAGVISYIYVAEGVNGILKSKVFGQGVRSRSRVGVGKGR